MDRRVGSPGATREPLTSPREMAELPGRHEARPWPPQRLGAQLSSAQYVHAADHGTGAGPALLNAVIDPEESAALWVADPNPRAHAFYRRHGFVADGTTQVEDGVREVRMVRGIQQSGS